MRTRRDFLRLAATASGVALFPASVRRALAIPPHRSTGTIKDVEHVVILMQENRSFDHYFGSLRGVRGFNDPRPGRLPNGMPVWYQPAATVKTPHYQNRGLPADAPWVLPFYINPKRTTEFQAGTDHGWSSGHLAWNHGLYDAWINQKQDVLSMGYLKREDVEFHYALAEAFTICDSYFCSVHADTAPNRIYLWSGTIDGRNLLGRVPNGPGFDERHKVNGYTWTTYPERLEEKGVTWKLYQGGSGEPGTPTDNFTDNSLEFFANYQVQEGASPTGPLVTKGVSNHTLASFRSDVINNRIAQVSWLVAPYLYSEHPEASPRDGASYISMILDALTANPEIWSKTVFIINYDENDGLFDHVIPPVPPLSHEQNSQGLVSDDLVESLAEEIIDLSLYPRECSPLIPGADPGGSQPIGLGPRVPLLIISPWTAGGWVCSQVFDHTSVLQFLEARFGVREPNISSWRRSICGDLTAVFDFSGRPHPAPEQFVVPAALASLHQPYSVPAPQLRPRQEPGTRRARALPYAVYTDGRVEGDAGRFWIDIRNAGQVGAAFYARNNLLPQQPPRRYSVSAGKAVSDYWLFPNHDFGADLALVAAYDLSLWGPNGQYSRFRGALSGQIAPEIRVQYDRESGDIFLRLTNTGVTSCTFAVVNAYDTARFDNAVRHRYRIELNTTAEDHWPLLASSGWFDLSVTAEEAPLFLRRFAGHVETGQPSISDPAVFAWDAEEQV